MHFHLITAALCLTGPTPWAQDEAPFTLESRVYFDQPGDDALWAVGDRWKMRFGSAGTTYVPFLGSQAPRNFPITFRVESVTVGGTAIEFERAVPAERAGDSVQFQRAAFVERYRLEPEVIEQLFEFDARPGTGDLVLRIATETELAASTRTEALVFSNEHGEVRYRKAIAIDARGERLALATLRVQGGVEIRVPAEFLDQAQFPLTIDPVISSFLIDDVFGGVNHSDSAWDETNQRYIVVWERYFSQSDIDIVSQFRAADGSLIPATGTYIDPTFTAWGKPSVANLHATSDFLVAVEAGLVGARDVRGRVRAATGALGFQFLIYNGTGEELNPVVGGDPFPGLPSYFCVSWERVIGMNHDVRSRLVEADGSLFGNTIALEASNGGDRHPAISKSNGSDAWTVAWQHEFNGNDQDIRAGQISWNGNVIQSGFPVDSSALNHERPSVSSHLDSGDYVIAYQQLTNNTSEIVARRLVGATSQDWMYVTDQDGSDANTVHYPPTVVSDGEQFFVVYNEHSTAPSGDFDRKAYITSLTQTATGFLAVDEGHVPLGGQSAQESRTAAAAAGDSAGAPGRVLATWRGRPISGPSSLFGAVFDVNANGSTDLGVPYCIAAGNSVSGTGSPIAATGTTNFGTNDLVLEAHDLPAGVPALFYFGANTTQSPFGEGFRCVGQPSSRLDTAFADAMGAVHLAVNNSAFPATQLAPGTTWYFQCWYRDPAGGPSGFNLTNGLQLIFM